MDKKTALRTSAKGLRKTLDIENISSILASKIRAHAEYIKAQNVMIFYPTTYEINLLHLLEDSKQFYLPRVNGDELDICPYQKCDRLKKSGFNILEPTNMPVTAEQIDLIIVPALMVDKKGYRLGYGGGYYDRLLAKSSARTICPIAKEFIVEELPHNQYDIKIDIIIST